MTPTNNSPVDTAADAVRSIGDKIAHAASTAKLQATDLGRTAAEKIEASRYAAASGLESTASALHQGGETFTGLAHSTADKLASTAQYLREHDVKSMMTDVERAVKRNPGIALLAAGVIGFLVGRTLRRGDSSTRTA